MKIQRLNPLRPGFTLTSWPVSLWEFNWPNFFARFLGISVPTSYPADHKGFRCRFDPSPLISIIRPHLRSKVVSKLLTCN